MISNRFIGFRSSGIARCNYIGKAGEGEQGRKGNKAGRGTRWEGGGRGLTKVSEAEERSNGKTKKKKTTSTWYDRHWH